VLDVARRQTHDVVVPGTGDPWAVTKALSPDGSSIALSYPGFSAPGGASRTGGVVVASTVNGATTRVRGVSTGDGHPLGVSWSADGRWLVLSASTTTFGRFAVWNTRSHQLTAMPWVVAQNISQDLLSTADGPLRAWR
jgi:Tol biopolymer transport system component